VALGFQCLAVGVNGCWDTLAGYRGVSVAGIVRRQGDGSSRRGDGLDNDPKVLEMGHSAGESYRKRC